MTAPKEESMQGKNAPVADGLSVPIDEMGLSGLSALLSFPPAVPFMQGAGQLFDGRERRSGQDRRKGERRQ